MALSPAGAQTIGSNTLWGAMRYGIDKPGAAAAGPVGGGLVVTLGSTHYILVTLGGTDRLKVGV